MLYALRRHSIYQFYGYFTLGLALLFLGFYLFEDQLQWWQAEAPKVLPIILGGYIALALANVILAKQHLPQKLDQFLPNQMLEILIMGFLMIYITPKQQDLAVLMLFHVGVGNLIVSKRYGYLLASMATIMVLAQGFLHPPHVMADRLLSGSFICILFFIEAAIVQVLRSSLSEAQDQAQQTQTQLESEAKLNDIIIERMHTGVCLINNAGVILRINRAAQERLTNVLPTQRIPESLFERFKYWQEYNLQNDNELAINSGDTINQVFIYFASIDKSSTLIFIESKETLVRKAHQFKLNSLARMAASIAHEIRNPLNAISHASQLLAENQQLSHEDKRLCDIIFNHCQRTDAIINNVMQISKRKTSEVKWIQLNKWLQDVSYELSEQFQCAVSIHGINLDIRFDPSQLQQIIWNLTQNAYRYGGANRNTGINIRLMRIGGRPCLRFYDSGPGLNAAAQEFLYEPFHTTSSEGSGLGLYLIKELCEANQAEIRYDHEYKDGAQFDILFAHDFEKEKGHTMSHILIVDDEPDILELLCMTIERMGFHATTACSIADANHQLNQRTFDLCLTDMRLPDGSGLDLVNHIQASYASMPVIVITAYGSVDVAIEAMKEGAFDFLSKPVELEKLKGVIKTALALPPSTPIQENDSDTIPNMIGESSAIKQLKAQIKKVARSHAPVFIHGESGSGKELVARAIHQLGPDQDKPFIAVNCGAIPSELMESEFFGHRKGAFTGATQNKEGFFQAAHGGTLFLDEVADLPLAMQVKLLRAIQENVVRPVGSETEEQVEVRILSASHKDLQLEVANRSFREDLFYRLDVINLQVPPLRDRSEDIKTLCEHIIKRLTTSFDIPAIEMDESALSALKAYDFPGNIRELENILQRAVTLIDGNTIYAKDLALKTTLSQTDTSNGTLKPGQSLEEYLEDIERKILKDTLEQCSWNKTAAAEQLGMSFRSMRYRLKKLNIE
jgi:DNA-binding NtrC family response regulator/signal transduction histidine kinase